jgi:hypothetical protein
VIINPDSPTYMYFGFFCDWSQVIPGVGHHVDLMFANPADTPQIRSARRFELDVISGWIQQARDDAMMAA